MKDALEYTTTERPEYGATMQMGMIRSTERAPMTRSLLLAPAILGVVVLIASLTWYFMFQAATQPKAQSIELSPASVSEAHLIDDDVSMESPEGQYIFRVRPQDTPGSGQFDIVASTWNQYAGYSADHLRSAFIAADGTVIRNTKIAAYTGPDFERNSSGVVYSAVPYTVTVPTGGKALGTGHLAFWLDQAADNVVYVAVNE